MKKITQESVNAFNRNENFKKANMSIVADDVQTSMYLHSNLIAVKNIESGVLSISNAGWESNTTKERLNGLDGVNIYQKNFVWYLNGEVWDGKLIEIN